MTQLNTKPDTGENVPALRFPEFEGEWTETKMAEVLKIGSGRDYTHLSKGDVPVYGTGGLMTYVDDYLFAGESVGIGRKGTIDKPVFLEGKFWTVDTLFYTHSFKNVMPLFIYAVFQIINWQKYNEASGVPSLSKGTIEKIKINVPCIEEQKKIAAFLGAVDDKITALQKKKDLLEAYKKGCMQKLFTQTLRFTDNNGNPFPDWQTKKLGDLVTLSAGTSKSKYISDDGLRFVLDMGSVSVSGKLIPSKKTNYNGDLLSLGDLVMPKDDIGGGRIIGRTGYVDKDDVYVLGDHVYLLSNIKCNSLFLCYLINSFEVNKSLRRRANGTAQLGLARNSVLKQKVVIPFSLDEQKKIADFLSAIDDKIALVACELDHAKTFKKGLLQQMFV